MKDYSNFHNIDTNARIERSGNLLLEQSLNAFGSTEVLVNDSYTTRVVLTQKYDGNGEVRKVKGRIEDIKRGNLLNISGLYWMITTLPEANQIYSKAEVTLCNETYPMVTGTIKTRVGTDALGKPIYEIIDETTHIPVIFYSKGYNIIDNDSISLPDDYADVMMQYVPDRPTPKINTEVKFNNNLYKVTSVERQKVINDQGYLEIRLERQVNK